MPKPKPFKRPSIDMDRSGRRWLTLPVHKVKPGDNIAGMGTVHHVNPLTNCSGEIVAVVVQCGIDREEILFDDPRQDVLAFTLGR